MIVLLDTHAFIWMDSEPHRLSKLVRDTIQDPSNEIWLSVVSAWEMVIKNQLGKLALSIPVIQTVESQIQNGIQVLDVSLQHVLAVELLPPIHRDPFDRILLAQAISIGASFISCDPILSQYPAPVIW